MNTIFALNEEWKMVWMRQNWKKIVQVGGQLWVPIKHNKLPSKSGLDVDPDDTPHTDTPQEGMKSFVTCIMWLTFMPFQITTKKMKLLSQTQLNYK